MAFTQIHDRSFPASMRIYIISALISIFLMCPAITKAQATQDALEENYLRAACLFHKYEFNEIRDSKAPKGFTPFYISHYGRHGSRFHTNGAIFSEGLLALKHAEAEQNLTEAGSCLLKQIDSLYNMHEGMYGALAPNGVREQQKLAVRMAERFPEVFKGTKTVDCYSSDIHRCIVSLAAFTGSLSAQYPDLNFSYESGERAAGYLRIEQGYAESKAYFYPLMYQAIAEACDWNGMMRIIFTDPSKVRISPYEMSSQLWAAWAICQCIEDVHIDIFRYFTPEQLLTNWRLRSMYYHKTFVRSDKFGEDTAEGCIPLMKDFIEKADAAIASCPQRGSRNAAGTGRNVAATIRFGHDSTLMPVSSLLGIDEFDDIHSEADPVTEKWDLGKHVCMASNLQLVFYRNKANKVLVKIMYNEKETTIPALTPYVGCYYDWTALREHMLARTASCL